MRRTRPGPSTCFIAAACGTDARRNGWVGNSQRGKLQEFDRLLRQPCAATSYSVIEGDSDSLFGPNAEAVRYVLTLDADTQLPHGAAAPTDRHRAAHPLNRPRFDASGTPGAWLRAVAAARQCVSPQCQPIAISCPHLGQRSRHRSVLQRAPRTFIRTCMAKGALRAKGLYDLDAFESCWATHFPENHILSHDLIEGCRTRGAGQRHRALR